MNLVMSSIDYNTASLEEREKFSFTKSKMCEIYKKLMENDSISGVVIMSTCNRTEIYISAVDNVSLNPFLLLCECIDINYNDYEKIYITKRNEKVPVHLCEVACGVKSQIWGEDQIISQVKESISYARDCNAADSVLEVLFRNAIGAAKRVKSTLEFKNFEDNASKRAAEIIKNKFNFARVLVIGNGAAGRSICEFLLKENNDVTMTLRQYKHSENIIPNGAKTIDYSLRYEYLQNVDAVVSATLSPHHTIKYDELRKLERLPELFIDLAVPRDIDPRVEEIDNITYYNIDRISKNEIEETHEIQMLEIHGIIKKYIDDFYKWHEYRTKIN